MFDSVSDFGIGDVWDMPLCDFNFSGLVGWVRCSARWIAGIEKLSAVYWHAFCMKGWLASLSVFRNMHCLGICIV